LDGLRNRTGDGDLEKVGDRGTKPRFPAPHHLLVRDLVLTQRNVLTPAKGGLGGRKNCLCCGDILSKIGIFSSFCCPHGYSPLWFQHHPPRRRLTPAQLAGACPEKMDPAPVQKKPVTLGGSLPKAGDAKSRDEGWEEVALGVASSH